MPEKHQQDICLKGVALSEGLTVARVCLFNEKRHSNLPVYTVSGEGIAREQARVRNAVEVAARRLDELREEVRDRVGAAEAEIFTVHKMILQDPELQKNISAHIEKDSTNAEAAVAQVLDVMERRMLALNDSYIRERASDVGEIKRRILDVMRDMRPSVQCAGGEKCQKGKNRIIVAEELTPSMTVDMDCEHVMGFVTERGGINSHAAILARALGVPSVSGIPGIRDRIACGTEVLVNGNTGEVIIWPSEKNIACIKAGHTDGMRLPLPVDPVEGFAVLANINTIADIREALSSKADGVGLYRTEIDVLMAGRILDENELYENYKLVHDSLCGAPVVFRLFDMGSDKPMPSVDLPRETNPALGWRGARLLLGKPDLLGVQARALARLARHGDVRVMYPMIVDLHQFLKLRKLFNDATVDIEYGRIQHGVMFEVPSACIQAREIMDVVDFASIGSNDLVQYLFAVDRDNEWVAADYQPDRPAFWRTIQMVVDACRATGKPLSICGEIAGDPNYTRKLIEAGIRTVSVSPRRISGVRAMARRILDVTAP